MVIGSPFLYSDLNVPRVTFLRGLADGVPSGECELCLVCNVDRSGWTVRVVVGRMLALDREAHDLERLLERYICTLMSHTLEMSGKKVVENVNKMKVIEISHQCM